MGRLLKRMFKLGLLAGAAYAVWRWLEAQRSESDLRWEPQPVPYPPRPHIEESPPATPVTATATASTAASPATESPATDAARATPAAPATDAGDAWVEPVGGACPVSHPVKAKMSSLIYHVAGGLNYERTHPDRCYRDPAAAEADGLRRAAR